MSAPDPEVVIVGAGAAGLAAARELALAEIPTLVLEARPRLFGRVRTVHDQAWPAPVETGAEFVHDEAPLTSALARRAAAALETVPDRHVILGPETTRSFGDPDERLQALLAPLRHSRGDRSLASVLAEQPANADAELVRFFVEGYHAAQVDRISARSLLQDDDPEANEAPTQRRPLAGYDAVLRGLVAALPKDLIAIRTDVAVTRIAWRPGHVTLESDSEIVEAPACIVTAPLGVLKARTLPIEPWPDGWDGALACLEVGAVQKVTLLLQEAFWTAAALWPASGRRTMPNFWHAPAEAFPTWWTTAPRGLPILTGWAGGPKAHSLAAQNATAIVDRAITSLAHMFELPRRRLESMVRGWHWHDWMSDPYSRGAYTYVGVNGLAAQEHLARPVDSTLALAGEALNRESIGTVEGAFASGRQAAHHILHARPGASSVRTRV
jgi:monoamine oxidase